VCWKLRQMIFAEKLRELRDAKGLSEVKLAEASRVSAPSLKQLFVLHVQIGRYSIGLVIIWDGMVAVGAGGCETPALPI